MSLYEVASMSAALDKLDETRKPQVSDDEWAQAEAMLAAVAAHDPNVRLH